MPTPMMRVATSSYWAVKVRSYAGPDYEGVLAGTMVENELIAENEHRSEATAFAEIEVLRGRLRNGRVSRVEIVDLRPGVPEANLLTNLNVLADTPINWSWLANPQT